MYSTPIDIDKQIKELQQYAICLPENSHRLLWAKVRIQELIHVRDNCIVDRNNVAQELIVKPIKVVYKGKVYKSIREASDKLLIGLNSLEYDIRKGIFKYKVYKLIE